MCFRLAVAPILCPTLTDQLMFCLHSCFQAVDNWVERFISNIQYSSHDSDSPRSPDCMAIGQSLSVGDLGSFTG
ncbi:hypothetical protein N431DRAFT_425650, partial [Stipitochalara longipes BDJ]